MGASLNVLASVYKRETNAEDYKAEYEESREPGCQIHRFFSPY